MNDNDDHAVRFRPVARRHARRLLGRGGVGRSDVEDVAQTVQTSFVTAFRKFDPVGAPPASFAEGVATNACRQLIRDANAKKRAGVTRSLAALPEDDYPTAPDRPHVIDLRIDLAEFLKTLPEDDRAFLEVLAAATKIAAVCRAAGMTRSACRYRVKKMRQAMAAAGLGIYCPGPGHPKAGPPVNTAGNLPNTHSNRRSA